MEITVYKRFFNNKLTLNYLKVYNDKIFIFITDTLARKNRFSRLLPRAWIGLLSRIYINKPIPNIATNNK